MSALLLKRKAVIYFVVLLCFLIEKSQAKSYSYHINQAELAIVDSNLDGALFYYTCAFEYPGILGRDVYNYILLASCKRNADSFLSILSSKINFTGFNLQSVPEQVRPIIKKLIAAAKLPEDFYEEARIYFSELEELDQWVRRNGAPDSVIQILQHTNFMGLVNFIKLNGYPTIEEYGFWSGSAQPFSPAALLLWHNSDEVLQHYLPLFLEEIRQGNIDPEELAFLALRMCRVDPECSVADDLGLRVWKLNGADKTRVTKIDAARLAWGLEPFNDYRRKWHFQQSGASRFNLSAPYFLRLIHEGLVPDQGQIDAKIFN